MVQRNQFTFYRSFWDAVQELPETDRLLVLEAIISYALDGQVPDTLAPVHRSIFTLCKPVLDTARKKAKAMKACRDKNNASDKEIEKEIEVEKEIETETEKEKEKEGKPDFPNRPVAGFERFWQLYPRKEGKLKAKEAYIRCGVEPEVLLDSIRRQCSSDQWLRENGRYIPLPASWLEQRRWEDEVAAVFTGRKPDAQEIAAVRRLMEDG